MHLSSSFWLLRCVAPILALVVRLLRRTWHVEEEGREMFEATVAEGGAVLAFFHGDQLPLIAVHADRGWVAMASLSADGELLARVVRCLGYDVIRGSSSRGGEQAREEAIRVLREGRCPGLAVDGPRGPRFQPHHGAMKIAACARRPVLFAAVQTCGAWRAGSWDRFVVPLPGATVRIRYQRMDPPLDTPEAIHEATLELGRRMRMLEGVEEDPTAYR